MLKTTVTAIVLLFSSTAIAEVTVNEGWYRIPVPGAAVTAAYFSISNSGKKADKLLRVSSSLAENHEIHNVRMTKDGHEMFHIPSLEIPAGKTVQLKPRGLHVMLIGIAQGVTHSKPVSFRLEFEKAGPLVVTVKPQAPKLN